MAKRKSNVEATICRKRLDALDKQELPRSDRFSLEEKQQLLRAYNERGFTIFQNTSLLKQYFSQRHEADLRGLIERYSLNLPPKDENPLLEWQNICNKSLGAYAKDKKINLDTGLSDAFAVQAEALKISEEKTEIDCDNEPDYADLLACFSNLLAGKFPEQMKPVNAIVSMKLYEDLMHVVDNIDVDRLKPLEDGTWLSGIQDRRKTRQTLACQGLEELDIQLKKCPSKADIDKSPAIEALCLELPKIKRIEHLLNPLHIDEQLIQDLMRQRMDIEND